MDRPDCWKERELAELKAARAGASRRTEQGVVVLGTAGGFTALLSAAACCVLPLAFAALGLGAGGFAAFVPYHWPLTIASGIVVAIGWALYMRKRRACLSDASCKVAPPRATLVMLLLATTFVAVSTIWPGHLERPLMRLIAGT